jgi:hypothetical protein
MGAAFRKQPLAQAQQFSRRGPERPHLLANFPSGRNNQQAGHDSGLMHVQPASAFHQGLHTLASLRKRLLRRRSVTDTAMRPSRFRVRQTVVPLSGAGQSGPRDRCPHRGSQPPSNRFPRNACNTRLTRPSAAPNFHAWWCAARRMTSGPEKGIRLSCRMFSISYSGASTVSFVLDHRIPRCL